VRSHISKRVAQPFPTSLSPPAFHQRNCEASCGRPSTPGRASRS